MPPTLGKRFNTTTNHLRLNYPLKWHPRFGHFDLPEGVLLLALGNEAHFIPSSQYRLLQEGITQSATADEIIARETDFFQSAMLMQRIRQLEKHQVILPLEASIPTYQTLSADAEPKQVAPGHFVHSVQPSLAVLISKIEVPSDAFLLWADDYLQATSLPWLRQQTQPVLLVSIRGNGHTIGPWLNTPTGPCPECLLHQLAWNQPARQWITNKLSVKSISLPVALLEQEITQELADTINDAFREQSSTILECRGGEVINHSTRKRPQCSVCGDSSLVSQQMQNRPKLDYYQGCGTDRDGGTRIISAKQTLQTCQHLISDLVGIATDLTPLFGQDEGQIPIFRSAFFRTPPTQVFPSGEAFSAISLGKGLSQEQSKVSALGETLERAAAQVQGDEFRVKAHASQLVGEVLRPQDLAPFSDRQYLDFAEILKQGRPSPDAVLRYTDDEINWTKAWSITDDTAYWVPLSTCIGGLGGPDRDFVIWGSNGAAAGNTLAEAVLQGLYELIEREATAIWWYHRIARPVVAKSIVPQTTLDRVNASISRDWEYWLLDLSHDWDIPVIGAIGKHKETGKFSLGFGAHHAAQIAAQRALTELCQLVPIRKQPKADFDFDAIPDAPFLYPNHDTAVPFTHSNLSIEAALQHCFRIAKNLDLKILVTDYSRPDLPLRTAKVIIPGLPHIWPQFASPRLYSVPEKLGWISSPSTEDNLNPMPLYI